MDSLSHNPSATPMTLAERSLALQLGNVFAILALVSASILTFSPDPKASKAVLYSYLVGDVGHIAIVYFTVGHQRFLDYANWNMYLIGNIGVAVSFSIPRNQSRWLVAKSLEGAFHVLRWATVLGLFGPIRAPRVSVEKKKRS